MISALATLGSVLACLVFLLWRQSKALTKAEIMQRELEDVIETKTVADKVAAIVQRTSDPDVVKQLLDDWERKKL